ncbi:hypothetical protein [Rhodococcus sp. NPDC058639]|uniref:hypothetical protein n=1 Tax=Rhodococcus sp. NPDC058639 TaxID=3346570 RepID=UPI003652B679
MRAIPPPCPPPAPKPRARFGAYDILLINNGRRSGRRQRDGSMGVKNVWAAVGTTATRWLRDWIASKA